MDINSLKSAPKTTQLPVSEFGLPITEDTSINYRGGADADYTLGKEAAMGLKALTGYAGTDFTITSATRGEDHPMYDPHSMHAHGNAIDFGVQSTDGKAALNFFFDDDEYTKLSSAGRQYLIDNNAELIDERTRTGQEHFHLEFNSPEHSRVLSATENQELYPDDYITGGGFRAYGVMGTYKENPYNQDVDYLKQLQELAGVDDHVEIGPTSDFFKKYGISTGKVKRQSTAQGLLANAKTVDKPIEEPTYTPRNRDPYTYYSDEKSPIRFKGSLEQLAFVGPGSLGDTKDIGKQWLTWDISLPVSRKSEVERQEEYRKQGITMWPGTSKAEAAADLQKNWSLYGKWPRGIAGGFETFGHALTEGASMLVFGIPAAIATGDFTGLYANPVNQALREYDLWFKQNYPHHSTAADNLKTENWDESWSAFRQSLTTANFWSRDFLQGVGFLASAYVGGAAAAEVGVGRVAYLAADRARRSIPRMLANNFRKDVLKSTFAGSAATLASRAGVMQRANIANYITAGLISAGGEATIEAGHIYDHSVKSMLRMRNEGVPAYQGMSDEELRELAGSYSDVAWLLNVGIVGFSNLLMFRHLFGGGYKNLGSKIAKEKIKRNVGAKIGERFKYVPKTKAGKILNTLYLGGRQTAVEGWEEWSQYGLELGGRDYFERQYVLDFQNEADMLQGLQGMANSMFRGFMKTPETKEGLQGIFLGALLGSLGGVYSGYRGTHAIQDYNKKVEATQQAVDELNILEKKGELYTHIKALSELSRLSRIQLNAVEDKDKFVGKTAEAAAAFEVLELLDKTGQMSMMEEVIADIAKLSDEEFAAAFELDEGETKVETLKEINRVRDAISSYKNTTKDIDPLINLIAAKLALGIDPALSTEEQQEKLEQIEYLKTTIKYNSFMSDHFDKRYNDLLSEISKLSEGYVNLSFMRDMDLMKKDQYTDAQQKIQAQIMEMIKSLPKSQLSTTKGEYMNELIEDFGFVNLMRQTFAKYVNELFDKPEQKSKEAVQQRKKQEEKGKKQNKDENERLAAEEAIKKERELEAKLQEEEAAKNKAEIDRLNKEQEEEAKKAKETTQKAKEEATEKPPATEDPLAKKESEKQNQVSEYDDEGVKKSQELIDLEKELNEVSEQRAALVNKEKQEVEKKNIPKWKKLGKQREQVKSKIAQINISKGYYAPKTFGTIALQFLQDGKWGDSAFLDTSDYALFEEFVEGVIKQGLRKGRSFEKVLRTIQEGFPALYGDQLKGKGIDMNQPGKPQLAFTIDQIAALKHYYAARQGKIAEYGKNKKSFGEWRRTTKQEPATKEQPPVTPEKESPKPNQPIENLETPDNSEVDFDNTERAETQEEDGKFVGKVTYLSDILSGAWKSTNNLFGVRGVDTETTVYLENPSTGNIAKSLITWSIDMEMLEQTAGGGIGVDPSARISAEALNIVKEKGELSQTDLDNIPIKGVITKDGNTVVMYLHKTGYVKTNMNPIEEIQLRETAKIRKQRRDVYEAIREGKTPTSIIRDMKMGHLNTVKNAQYPIDLVLNGGKLGTKQPVFVVSDGQNYLDENGQPAKDIYFESKQKFKGAVYFKLPAANGMIFPARASIRNLDRETAELLYNIYKARMDQQIALTTKLTKETVDSMPDAGVMKSYKEYLNELIADETLETPTFADVLNMLIYDKSKKTPIIFKPFTDKKGQNKQTLTLATNRYTYDQMESKKEEIIDWLVENKRYNINRQRLNTKDNFKYNNWLIANKILHTNIFANPETTGAFVQPTVRFGYLVSNVESAPEAPVAPKKPTKGSFAGMTQTSTETVPESFKKAVAQSEVGPNKAELNKIVESKEKESKQLTIKFGGVDVSVAKDETAPVLPESENTVPTLPTEEESNTVSAPEADVEKTVSGEKESVSPNQVTKGVDLKSLPKRKKPKGVSVQKIKPSKDQLKDDC